MWSLNMQAGILLKETLQCSVLKPETSVQHNSQTSVTLLAKDYKNWKTALHYR